ncbi:MAG: cytochrome c biogenesis protein CcsA [Bacteroidia bacterium]
MTYIGEHLIFGQAGRLFIVLAFTASLLSSVAYLFSAFRKNDKDAWKPLARGAFALHGISIVSIFGILFYIIYNHYFEYYYAWFHSSTTMPTRYIFACFWEGQEGSFLLWTFWHVVLSLVIIKKAPQWEAPVLSVIMMVQVFLCSMVLGTWIGDLHIGSNPFVLLREHPDFAAMPFASMSDYLQKIKDGRGLNPLLQNYWMVIHPPTLFLGFASTVVPFAFAMAGFMTGKVREWIKPALPFTYFGVMILGTGILMGAAWAYEALSFGGFWAWDPVENASLVPWLTFVGAAHVMLITKRNGNALMSSFLLSILTFVLILYSTFLTRSGILGEASVHAFTDLGMSGQLIFYMAFFAILAITLLIINWKKIAPAKEEDSLTSREFWMFIGTLVLLISAIQIITTTSIPVYNAIFNTKHAPPVDLIDHYNKWQVPIAAIVCLLFAVGQFFKYKKTEMSYFIRKIILSFIAAFIVTVIYQYYMELPRWQHVALLFAALFAACANLDYMIRVIKGNITHSGASIAHVGIALIMLGALVSNSKKEVISQNMNGVDLGKDFPNNENIMLTKGDTTRMGNYFVTYEGSKKEGIHIYYGITYLKLNNATGKLDKQFELKPTIQLNERMGNAAEPDTKRFIDKDLYTHITFAELDEKPDESSEYSEPKTVMVKQGDTLTSSNSLIVLEGLSTKVDGSKYGLSKDDIIVAANISATDVNKQVHYVSPVYIIKGGMQFSDEAVIDALGLKFLFTKIDTKENKIELKISEKKSNRKDFVIMKAVIFPHINILWIGCVLMIIGSWIAVRKRFAELKRVA